MSGVESRGHGNTPPDVPMRPLPKAQGFLFTDPIKCVSYTSAIGLRTRRASRGLRVKVTLLSCEGTCVLAAAAEAQAPGRPPWRLSGTSPHGPWGARRPRGSLLGAWWDGHNGTGTSTQRRCQRVI